MLEHLASTKRDEIRRPTDDAEGLILEAWAQGFMVGTLVFMAAITVANMRRHVLLHKLILAEVRKASSAISFSCFLASTNQQSGSSGHVCTYS